MIKVKNDLLLFPDNPISQVINEDSVINAMRDLGVDLGNHSHYDFVLATDNDIKEINEPTFLYTRIDGAQVKSSTRRHLSNPNLLRLIKNYTYSDYEINNIECVGGRPFTRFLYDCEYYKKGIEITKEQAGKIRIGISFLHYKKLDLACVMGKSKPLEKDIDVFFAGTVDRYANGVDFKNPDRVVSAGELVAKHRRDAFEAVVKYGETHNVKVVALCGRPLNQHEYIETMARSKITVSPWGWGEPCYRDYEALLNRCEIIKPTGDSIIANPYVYNSYYMRFCKPDFSDLGEIITHELASFNQFSGMRKEFQEYLFKMRESKNIAKIISEIVKESVE